MNDLFPVSISLPDTRI